MIVIVLCVSTWWEYVVVIVFLLLVLTARAGGIAPISAMLKPPISATLNILNKGYHPLSRISGFSISISRGLPTRWDVQTSYRHSSGRTEHEIGNFVCYRPLQICGAISWEFPSVLMFSVSPSRGSSHLYLCSQCRHLVCVLVILY